MACLLTNRFDPDAGRRPPADGTAGPGRAESSAAHERPGRPALRRAGHHPAATGISAAGIAVSAGRRGGSGAASTATTNSTTSNPSTTQPTKAGVR